MERSREENVVVYKKVIEIVEENIWVFCEYEIIIYVKLDEIYVI